MRASRGVVLAVGAVAGFGVLLHSAQQATVASNAAERACLAALEDELALGPDAGLRTASWRAEAEGVAAEWRYGSTRAGSGVVPLGSGEVRCAVRDGEVTSIDVETYTGTP